MVSEPYLIITESNYRASPNLYQFDPSTGRTQQLLSPGVAVQPWAVTVDQSKGYCYWADFYGVNTEINLFDLNNGTNTGITYIAGGNLNRPA